MKIRFSKSDQIDTTQMGQGGGSVDPAVAQEVEDIKNVVDDGEVDNDDYTRFNHVLRALRGIMQYAEAMEYEEGNLKAYIQSEFEDLYDFDGKNAQVNWGTLVDTMDYAWTFPEPHE